MTRQQLKNMTKTQLEELARNMATPLRCGGLDRIDGVSGYYIQGWFVPEEVIENSRAAYNGNPWVGIKEYQDTHERYVK